MRSGCVPHLPNDGDKVSTRGLISSILVLVFSSKYARLQVIGGDWHTQFPGIDLPVEKLPDAMRFLQTSMPCRLFPFVAAALPQLCSDPADLRVSDLFLVKYDVKLGQLAP